MEQYFHGGGHINAAGGRSPSYECFYGYCAHGKFWGENMSQRSLFDKFKAIFTKREALNTKPPGYSVPELTEEERQRLLDAGLAPVPKTEKEYKSDISFREIIYSFMEEYKNPQHAAESQMNLKADIFLGTVSRSERSTTASDLPYAAYVWKRYWETRQISTKKKAIQSNSLI